VFTVERNHSIINIYIFYSPKAAANIKATKEKAEHLQITTIFMVSGYIYQVIIIE